MNFERLWGGNTPATDQKCLKVHNIFLIIYLTGRITRPNTNKSAVASCELQLCNSCFKNLMKFKEGPNSETSESQKAQQLWVASNMH